jgi:uncharacterized membrane protein SpoIIM required for sporulation
MYQSKHIYYFCISAFSIISGFGLSYYIENSMDGMDLIKNSQGIILFRKEIFCGIFFNNTLVGLLISLLGFLTGGFASIIILFWNGVIIGGLLKSHGIQDAAIPYFIYHGIFEITALLGFGVVGLKGWDFYVNLFKNNEIKIQFHKNLFIYSLILLFISAIIETLLISSLE